MSFMFIIYNEFYRIILHIIITAMYVYVHIIIIIIIITSLLLKPYVLVYHKIFMCMNINKYNNKKI